jgi:RNA polymerase sigma-70 factor (ECF subfamily)
MPEKSDEEIAKEVQGGSVQAFGVLMKRYEDKLLRYARRFVSDGADMQDLVQDVFIKAYSNIKSFDINRKFSPWIYRIAHNEFVNAIKKKVRERIFSFDLDVLLPHQVRDQKVANAIDNDDLRKMLDKCLNKIEAKYREPLVLYYFEELDYKEIAEILKMPISTVGIRLQRGREALKKIVEKMKKYGK